VRAAHPVVAARESAQPRTGAGARGQYGKTEAKIMVMTEERKRPAYSHGNPERLAPGLRLLLALATLLWTVALVLLLLPRLKH
jgi:hypothetical protein